MSAGLRARLEMLGSIVLLWALGLAIGTTVKAFASTIHPKTVAVFASAVAPTYALRVGIRSVPAQFDFERFDVEVEGWTQLVRHATAATLAVAVGTVAGTIVGSAVDATVPSVSPSLAMLVAGAVSWVVGLRALVSLNAEYRVA